MANSSRTWELPLPEQSITTSPCSPPASASSTRPTPSSSPGLRPTSASARPPGLPGPASNGPGCSSPAAPPGVARRRLEWARMLLTRRQPGEADRARELLGQALDTARELGLADVERRAVELLETV